MSHKPKYIVIINGIPFPIIRSETEEKILNKIDSFKDTLNDVNARMSSLEKAFKEALPALIESVRSLTDLVQRIKREG